MKVVNRSQVEICFLARQELDLVKHVFIGFILFNYLLVGFLSQLWLRLGNKTLAKTQ